MNLTWSLFPKNYAHLSPKDLATLVRECGLDTVNVVIGDGYVLQIETVFKEFPAYVGALRAQGLDPKFASTKLTAEEVAAQPDLLKLLADNGIRQFRLGWLNRRGYLVRSRMKKARESLERLVPHLEAADVQAVYHLRNETLLASPTAAYHLIRGLPPYAVGIEIDPGNQSIEGFESWDYTCAMLAEYIVAVGVKDTALHRDAGRAGESDKGWTRTWAPADEGVTNWHALFVELSRIAFSGTAIVKPLYSPDDEATRTKTMAREVAYLRAIAESIEVK